MHGVGWKFLNLRNIHRYNRIDCLATASKMTRGIRHTNKPKPALKRSTEGGRERERERGGGGVCRMYHLSNQNRCEIALRTIN